MQNTSLWCTSPVSSVNGNVLLDAMDLLVNGGNRFYFLLPLPLPSCVSRVWFATFVLNFNHPNTLGLGV